MTRLSVYDPFAEVFPELFRGFLAPSRATAGTPAIDVRIDVRETAGAYTVSAEMPGVTRDDIQVQIDGNRVAISAEVRRESEARDGERVLRSERGYGTMSRSFALASELDDAAATARYENGVLVLTLPKKAVAGARKLTIN
jgi:HSP20 family protein